jgi:hypothetical protein
MPNTAAIYPAGIPRDQTLVWLLMPSEGPTPAVQAKVLSENDRELQVEVTANGKTRKLMVPFGGSEGVVVGK